MVTVAEAAAALGIDERTVRDKLSKDEWKGEKRMIGLKEKWFMHRGELDRQLEKLKIVRAEDRLSTQGLDNVFETDDITGAHTIDAQTVEVESTSAINPSLSMAIDEILAKLTEQFSKQLNTEKEAVFLLKKELEEKDRQLKLLPDFQAQAEKERKAAELKELEAEALRKQISAMEAEQTKAELAKQEAQEEIERLKVEKAAESKAVQEQLQALTATVLELQKPKPSWWQKWFTAQEK